MTIRNRLTIAMLLAVIATVAGNQPAQAHGGDDRDLTSNYRTRILDTPDIDGLSVTTVGLDGELRLTWSGTGTLIVTGYQNEPYLRFDANGVARNLRSPATYLNQSRYGDIELPEHLDTTAEPDWQPVTRDRTYQWHDHRTHWMLTTPPTQVQAAPNKTHLVIERWEVTIAVDDTPATITGDLTWKPPGSLAIWLTITALIAAASTVLLHLGSWRLFAAAIAAIGTVALATDTAGVAAVIDDTLANRVWMYVYATIAALATIRLSVHARRCTPHPTLAMIVAGLVLAIMGGLDRLEVITSGFYLSNIDIHIARTAVAICLGTGIALTTRFLLFLLPLLGNRGDPPTDAAQADAAIPATAGAPIKTADQP